MERIEITITGELPEVDKYEKLAAAQKLAGALLTSMFEEHGITLTATVKSVRPNAKKAPAAPASPVRAVAAE